jgi:hypothetical protein
MGKGRSDLETNPRDCSAGDASQVASPGVSPLLEAQVKAKVDTCEGGGRDHWGDQGDGKQQSTLGGRHSRMFGPSLLPCPALCLEVRMQQRDQREESLLGRKVSDAHKPGKEKLKCALTRGPARLSCVCRRIVSNGGMRQVSAAWGAQYRRGVRPLWVWHHRLVGVRAWGEQ